MSDAPTPEQQAEIDQLAQAVATDLANGIAPGKIADGLMKRGLEPDAARNFVAGVADALAQYRASPEGRQILADKFAKHMGMGALWCVGGAVVTALTYSAASDTGGTYVVAWGAIVFGGVEFLYGLGGWMRTR